MRLKALTAGFTRSADYPFILTVNLLPEKEEADFFTKKLPEQNPAAQSDEDGLHYSAVLDDCILVDDDDAVMN